MEISKMRFVLLIAAFVTPLEAFLYRMSNPTSDVMKTTTELESAYEASGFDKRNNFQTDSMKKVLDQEKAKAADCESLVSSAMQHLEDKETEKIESTDQCSALVEQKLNDVPSELRSRAEKDLRARCADLLAAAQDSQADDQQKRLELQMKCKDLFKGVLESVDAATENTAHMETTNDFSLSCPEGWHEVGEGGGCEAPPSYTGPCGTLMVFAGDSEEKKRYEKHCFVKWPSLSACNNDYSVLCPEHWEDIGAGKCRASSSYSGRCERTYTFSALSAEEKEKWSAACGVQWPCQPSTICDRDYTIDCPQMWTNAGQGVCDAPEEYRGPCGPRQSLGKFDEKMKHLFEKRCSVAFPCKRTCVQDYSQPCPENWIMLDEGNSCAAPETYGGNCKANNVQGKTEADRKKFSIDCGVRWPCVEECKRDYSDNCPMEWAEDGGYCYAPDSYDGPCEHQKKFSTYSDDMKVAAQHECYVHWPCEGEQQARPMVLGGVGRERGEAGSLQRPLPRWMSGLQKYGHSGPIEPTTGFVVAAA